jgi:hypothetical protein
VSRPTRGSHDALPVRACHPLWSAVPDASGSRRPTTGLVPVRSPLLRESRLMSFPPGTEMVQFPGFAPPATRTRPTVPHEAVGCPIRKSADHRALAPPRGLSQRATSFIASRRQGIHQMPFSRSPRPSPGTPRAPEPERPSIPCQRSTAPGSPGSDRTRRARPTCRARPPTLFTMSKPPSTTRPIADRTGGPGPNRTADLTLIRGAL